MDTFSSPTVALMALNELIDWINESDYSDDSDPRLTPGQWASAQDLALTNASLDECVAFLRRMPRNQVLLPDTY
jgi:hypothetical protein